MLYLRIPLQGQDGVDLEMNINGAKSTFEDDEFDDVVCLTLARFQDSLRLAH